MALQGCGHAHLTAKGLGNLIRVEPAPLDELCAQLAAKQGAVAQNGLHLNRCQHSELDEDFAKLHFVGGFSRAAAGH